MDRREGRFAGEGATEIQWQAWLPGGDAKAVVAISHGVSEHTGRYEHVAERLVGSGYAVYALDHRGHGRSQGRPAMLDRLSRAVEDLHTLVRLARSEYPERKLFLLGHSMGGALALGYAFSHQDELAGLALSSPLAALEAAPALQRLAGRVLSTVAPKVGVLEVDASKVSRDPGVVRAYEQDPLVYRGKLPARTVAELTRAIDSFPERVGALRLPLLVMLGTGDRLVPPEGGRMVHERAGFADKSLVEYDGLYHEILNEPERERVLADLVAWLDARA